MPDVTITSFLSACRVREQSKSVCISKTASKITLLYGASGGYTLLHEVSDNDWHEAESTGVEVAVQCAYKRHK
jgi:hypothetical protein